MKGGEWKIGTDAAEVSEGKQADPVQSDDPEWDTHIVRGVKNIWAFFWALLTVFKGNFKFCVDNLHCRQAAITPERGAS